MHPDFIKKLKSKVHHLKPIILIGDKGLSESVIEEILIALKAHKLIKIKFHSNDRELRKKLAQEICQKVEATLVHSIGKTIAIYKPSLTDN